MAGTPLLGALLATDGYGNAQVARAWEGVVSADLAGLIAARSASWLASRLPEWAGRCASVDGSGDDATMALLLAPAVAAAPEPGACPARGQILGSRTAGTARGGAAAGEGER